MDPGGWRWIALPIGLFFAFISVAMAVTVPRPSTLSDERPVIGAAMDARGQTRRWDCAEAYAIQRAGVGRATVRGRHVSLTTGRARIECVGGGVVEASTETNLEGDGEFTLEARGGELRIVSACFACEPDVPESPRTEAQVVHGAGIALGILAVGVLLYFWIMRPLDTLRDLAGACAPRSATVEEQPSNDRVIIGERTLSGSFIGVRAGKPEVIAERPPAGHVAVAGSGADYRAPAGALITLVGPAFLNGQPLPRGASAPLASGDRVELAGAAPFVIAFPVPGRMLRYLVRDGVVRIGRRVASFAWPWARALALVGSAAFIAAHLDIPLRGPIAGGLAMIAAWLCTKVPPRLSALSTTELPLADLVSGERVLCLTELRGRGLRIEIDREHVGWLRAPGRWSSARRRALHGVLRAELDALARLG